MAKDLVSIRESFMLKFYAIAFVFGAIVFADHFLFGGVIKSWLPHRPQELIGWNLLFGMPHIVASFIPLLNRESLEQHRNGLLIRGVLAISILMILNFVFSPFVFFAVYLAWEITHAVDQQFGLAKNFSKGPDSIYPFWRMSGVGISIFLNMRIHLGTPTDPTFLAVTNGLVWFAVAVFVVTTILWSIKAKVGVGANFLYANFSLVLLSFSFYSLGYSFFSIAIGRIIHDVTANYFYYVHEINRTQTDSLDRGGFNFQHPLLRTLYLPLIAIGFGALLTYENLLTPVMFWIGNAMALMHYMNETYVWKQGSVLRNYTPLIRSS